MDEADKRQKVEMAVLSRLQRDRTRAAAVTTLAPLIARANVSEKLKREVLDGAKLGIPQAEIERLGPKETVHEILAALVKAGSVRVNTAGEFESALELPDLSVREAGLYATKLLHTWPKAERAKIVAVFSNGDAYADADDES